MSHHEKNEKVVVEGDGFTAKLHESEDGWHAQVRVKDDEGARGRVLNFFAADAQGLAARLGGLASSLTAAQNKVVELGTTLEQTTVEEPVQQESPRWE